MSIEAEQPADGARLAFAAIEATALAYGHSAVLEGWGHDLRLMRGDNAETLNSAGAPDEGQD